MQTVATPLRTMIVIPARLDSSRLPRKLLLRETGKSVLQHTYESASQARCHSGVCVAADCEEIAAEVRAFGGNVKLTNPDCASGTDRVAAFVRDLADVDVVVNVQGDEPEISAAAIDLAVQLLEFHPEAMMSTLAAPLRSKDRLFDPSCVKVVFDYAGRASYFSRAPIPYPRNWDDGMLTRECRRWNLARPRWSPRNVKAMFAAVYGERMGLRSAIEATGGEFEGRNHRGLDDARNGVRVLQWLRARVSAR